ncbi:hypothetical protein [Actinomadura chibensis]|uniref:Uncharacterized protein n=1 Tax=Actinomadura chibensis TaxID=392828 RepID=A0A5D0NLZ9_9ACTN|nr:hypothetical protein [Actinomadura chibensis]TYB45523.1 hypothetical protein FXF69_19015 [Actinomadura chibensis]
MTSSPTLLSEADGFFVLLSWDLDLDGARAALASGTLGVVQDDEGRFVATVLHGDLADETARDLRAALPRLPPAVVVDADVTFAEFAGSAALTLLDLGARALVLADGGRAVAVLPVEMVGAHLASRDYTAPSNEMAGSGGLGDGALPGRPRTGLAPAVCLEPGCGHVNWLASFDPDRPPWCERPAPPPRHRLRLGG